MVPGNAGSGDSRLAAGLARRRALAPYRLDTLVWNPDWSRTPEAACRRRHDELVAGERWIADSVASRASVVHRIVRADTVVLVDRPLPVQHRWAAKRQFMCLFRPPPDLVPGCPMLPMRVRLVRMMWWLHRPLRPPLLALVERSRRGRFVYVLRTRREADAIHVRFCA